MIIKKLAEAQAEWVRLLRLYKNLERVLVVVFGVTVACSIKTTAAKAISLRAKEKSAAEKSALLGNGNQETTTYRTACFGQQR